VVVGEDLYKELKVLLRYRRLQQHHPQSMRLDNDLITKSTAQYAVVMWQKIRIQDVMGGQRIDPYQ
jgi:hypothetical protein